MTEPVEFLRARYDERERKAKAAAGDYPHWDTTSDGNVVQVGTGGSGYLAVGPWEGDLFEVGEHMADHDPAYVLADLDVKRRILELHADPHECPEWDRPLGETCTGYYGAEGCPTVRLQALPFAGHPDYRSEWAVAK